MAICKATALLIKKGVEMCRGGVHSDSLLLIPLTAGCVLIVYGTASICAIVYHWRKLPATQGG